MDRIGNSGAGDQGDRYDGMGAVVWACMAILTAAAAIALRGCVG